MAKIRRKEHSCEHGPAFLLDRLLMGEMDDLLLSAIPDVICFAYSDFSFPRCAWSFPSLPPAYLCARGSFTQKDRVRCILKTWTARCPYHGVQNSCSIWMKFNKTDVLSHSDCGFKALLHLSQKSISLSTRFSTAVCRVWVDPRQTMFWHHTERVRCEEPVMNEVSS